MQVYSRDFVMSQARPKGVKAEGRRAGKSKSKSRSRSIIQKTLEEKTDSPKGATVGGSDRIAPHSRPLTAIETMMRLRNHNNISGDASNAALPAAGGGYKEEQLQEQQQPQQWVHKEEEGMGGGEEEEEGRGGEEEEDEDMSLTSPPHSPPPPPLFFTCPVTGSTVDVSSLRAVFIV
jgi:hypothetical protein